MKDVQKFTKKNTYVISKILPWQGQMTTIGNYHGVANSNVNRMKHVKSVHKMSKGETQMRKNSNFWGVVTIATADSPNSKLSWCGKFN